MKITIDTKEDSHDEIRKVIKMLSHLVGEHPTTNQPDIFEDSSSFGVPSTPEPSSAPSGNVFGNMFDAPTTPTKSSEPTETEEKPEPKPEIIPY